MAGMPSPIGTLESVLLALGVTVKPSALPAATAMRTMRALSGCEPAGRNPIVSRVIVSGTVLFGQRASSSRSASRIAIWNFASSAASDAALSERMSTSTMPSYGIEFTDVPPCTTLALNVVFGESGTVNSAIFAIARPIAWIGFGMPNAP